MKKISFILLTFLLCSCSSLKITESEIGLGWARNSVNTVIFRKNAVTSFNNYQFTAYYDPESNLILAKRKLGSDHWEKLITKYKGNTNDAHRDISLAIDGEGYLHVSWDHHDSRLRYAKSKEPLGLELGPEIPMTGKLENKVTYPEFYNLPDGGLLFLYRSGQSGRGSLIMNSYNTQTKTWKQLHSNLIDGEGERSSYWQACVDNKGTIHLSWTWRESWDVSTNHDICYARSDDGGKTWKKSSGEKYSLPITLKSAEVAWKIPQKSNLINQTNMTTDADNRPYIASYWEENDVTQYQIVFENEDGWKLINTGFRTTNFDLGGGGTKRIPVSRPEILISNNNKGKHIHLLYRDEERDNRISLSSKSLDGQKFWKIRDLTSNPVGQWEPNYDIRLWKEVNQLQIFVQKVIQIDAEGLGNSSPTPVKILEVKGL